MEIPESPVRRLSFVDYLGFLAQMEPSMTIVPPARFLRRQPNRRANIAAGTVRAVAAVEFSLRGGPNYGHYLRLAFSLVAVCSVFADKLPWRSKEPLKIFCGLPII